MENSAFEMYGGKRGKEEDEVSSRIAPKPGVTKQEEIRLAHRFWRNRKNTVPRFSREPSWEETLGYRHGMMYGDVSSSYANKTEAAYRRIRDAKTPEEMEAAREDMRQVVRGYRLFQKHGVYRRGSGVGEKNTGYIHRTSPVQRVADRELRDRTKKMLTRAFESYRHDVHNLHGGNVTSVLHREFLDSIPGIAEYVAKMIQEDPTYANYMTGPAMSMARGLGGACSTLFGKTLSVFLPTSQLGWFMIPLGYVLKTVDAVVTEKILMRGRMLLQEEGTKEKIRVSLQTALERVFMEKEQRSGLATIAKPLARSFSSVISLGLRATGGRCSHNVSNLVVGMSDKIISEFLKERIQYHLGKEIDHRVIVPLVRKHSSTLVSFISGTPNLDHKILDMLLYIVDAIDIRYIRGFYLVRSK